MGKKTKKMTSIDRLSSLPDDIICHILSFLPTNLAVETSILAKRYRFLWPYVPSLYFHNCYYSKKSFLYMIRQVMLLNKAPRINTFHLSCNWAIDSRKFELETWITTVIERNVQTFFLNLWYEDLQDMCVLPVCLFSCKSLVDLALGCYALPSFSSGSITLPSLKSLNLLNIDYVVDDALPCLLSCCPVLDKLFIRGLVLGNFYNISSPSIKSLFVSLSNDESDIDVLGYELKIHAPALEHLKLKDSSSLVISGHMLSSLIEADINFDGHLGVELNNISFLESLSNTRCLKLCGGPFFSSWGKSITRFDNLTQLEFGGDWLFLMNLIENAENLEVLIVNQVDDEDLEKWMEPKQVPKCVLSRLKTVKFDKFWCGELEFEVVGYFLKNASVLERMEIYSSCVTFDSKAKLVALQRISLFERGSVACRVGFY